MILNHTNILYTRQLISVWSKVNRIRQKSENPVNPNAPKFTKIAWTQSNEIDRINGKSENPVKQNAPKLTKVTGT